MEPLEEERTQESTTTKSTTTKSSTSTSHSPRTAPPLLEVPPPEEPAAHRPQALRRSTDPLNISSTPAAAKLSLPLRPRTRSPYSRSHLRSRSSNSPLALAPPMTRAYSSPLADTLPEPAPPHATTARPASPQFQARRASPLRRAADDAFAEASGVPTIAEDGEPSADAFDRAPLISPLPVHSTVPRVRRRPSSPLQRVLPAPCAESLPSPRTRSPARTLHTSSSVPSLSAHQQQPPRSPSAFARSAVPGAGARFNEAYPTTAIPPHTTTTTTSSSLSSSPSAYSLSTSVASAPSLSTASMPGTPTSLRSRSPSVSSLDTIPDIPDGGEEAAVERERLERLWRAERIEKLRGLIGAEEGEEGGGGRRNWGPGALGAGAVGAGSAAGRERKRWSVSGAERRGDLEMETIWED